MLPIPADSLAGAAAGAAPPSLPMLIAAVGAIGTAAMAVVEKLKGTTSLGEAGFDVLRARLGPLWETLLVAFGREAEGVLRGAYRGDDADLARLLRQGVRIGLTAENAPTVATTLGSVDPAALAEAVRVALEGGMATTAQRALIARYEAAADARIDGAVQASHDRYEALMRLSAALVAVGLTLFAAAALGRLGDGGDLLRAVFVGVVAVPIAPVAKDLADGLQSALAAIGRR